MQFDQCKTGDKGRQIDHIPPTALLYKSILTLFILMDFPNPIDEQILYILKESSSAYSKQFTTKLNCVDHIQYYVVKQNFNINHIMCLIFRTIHWVLCKVQLN